MSVAPILPGGPNNPSAATNPSSPLDGAVGPTNTAAKQELLPPLPPLQQAEMRAAPGSPESPRSAAPPAPLPETPQRPLSPAEQQAAQAISQDAVFNLAHGMASDALPATLDPAKQAIAQAQQAVNQQYAEQEAARILDGKARQIALSALYRAKGGSGVVRYFLRVPQMGTEQGPTGTLFDPVEVFSRADATPEQRRQDEKAAIESYRQGIGEIRGAMIAQVGTGYLANLGPLAQVSAAANETLSQYGLESVGEAANLAGGFLPGSAYAQIGHAFRAGVRGAQTLRVSGKIGATTTERALGKTITSMVGKNSMRVVNDAIGEVGGVVIREGNQVAVLTPKGMNVANVRAAIAKIRPAIKLADPEVSIKLYEGLIPKWGLAHTGAEVAFVHGTITAAGKQEGESWSDVAVRGIKTLPETALFVGKLKAAELGLKGLDKFAGFADRVIGRAFNPEAFMKGVMPKVERPVRYLAQGAPPAHPRDQFGASLLNTTLAVPEDSPLHPITKDITAAARKHGRPDVIEAASALLRQAEFAKRTAQTPAEIEAIDQAVADRLALIRDTAHFTPEQLSKVGTILGGDFKTLLSTPLTDQSGAIFVDPATVKRVNGLAREAAAAIDIDPTSADRAIGPDATTKLASLRAEFNNSPENPLELTKRSYANEPHPRDVTLDGITEDAPTQERVVLADKLASSQTMLVGTLDASNPHALRETDQPTIPVIQHDGRLFAVIEDGPNGAKSYYDITNDLSQAKVNEAGDYQFTPRLESPVEYRLSEDGSRLEFDVAGTRERDVQQELAYRRINQNAPANDTLAAVTQDMMSVSTVGQLGSIESRLRVLESHAKRSQPKIEQVRADLTDAEGNTPSRWAVQQELSRRTSIWNSHHLAIEYNKMRAESMRLRAQRETRNLLLEIEKKRREQAEMLQKAREQAGIGAEPEPLDKTAIRANIEA